MGEFAFSWLATRSLGNCWGEWEAGVQIPPRTRANLELVTHACVRRGFGSALRSYFGSLLSLTPVCAGSFSAWSTLWWASRASNHRRGAQTRRHRKSKKDATLHPHPPSFHRRMILASFYALQIVWNSRKDKRGKRSFFYWGPRARDGTGPCSPTLPLREEERKGEGGDRKEGENMVKIWKGTVEKNRDPTRWGKGEWETRVALYTNIIAAAFTIIIEWQKYMFRSHLIINFKMIPFRQGGKSWQDGANVLSRRWFRRGWSLHRLGDGNNLPKNTCPLGPSFHILTTCCDLCRLPQHGHTITLPDTGACVCISTASNDQYSARVCTSTVPEDLQFAFQKDSS